MAGEHRWWKKAPEGDADNPWSGLAGSNSVDVEMTSYALLTYLQRGLVEKALPVMQWLIAQRNSNGGFASTQVRMRLRLVQLTRTVSNHLFFVFSVLLWGLFVPV